MAYAIMRAEKRGAGALGGLEAENNRDHQIDLKASDVDWSKTDQNVFLVKNDHWKEVIDNKLEEHGITKYRKDAVLAIDVLYTASPEFFVGMSKDEIINYFKDCLEAHINMYGDFVINSAIHLDEKTPHMHTICIPICDRGDHYALSAKELMGGRVDYHNRQDQFFEHISQKWDGLERGEVKDPATKREHLDVLSYKLETEENKLAETRLDIEYASQELKTLKSEIFDYERQIDQLERKISLAGELEALIDKIVDWVCDKLGIDRGDKQDMLSDLEFVSYAIDEIEAENEVIEAESNTVSDDDTDYLENDYSNVEFDYDPID